MDRSTATQQIRDACRTIAQQLMKIHPAVPNLADAPTQDAIFKHLHQLTTELESVKKKLAQLEKQDASAEL